MAGINRYGPFVQLEKKYVRLEPDDDVLTIGMNRAIALLTEPRQGQARGRTGGAAARAGPHPKDGEPVQLLPGRFGPYVKHGKLNASLPKAATPETFTLEQAVQLLADREAKLAAGGGQPGARRGAARRRPAASSREAKPAAKAKPAAAQEAGAQGREALLSVARPRQPHAPADPRRRAALPRRRRARAPAATRSCRR